MAIGSLRFRVRTKKAAKNLLRRNKKEVMTIQYTPVERGKLKDDGSSSFVRYTATEQGTDHPVTVQEWAEIMTRSNHAAQDMIQVLKASEYKAFFWETKGVTAQNASTKNFEFVIVDAPRLFAFADQNPNPSAFQRHLDACDQPGCQFSNLGGDATLIAPRKLPSTPLSAYSHFAAFVEKAPSSQIQKVLQLSAQAYHKRLQQKDNTKPVWFSTSGMGIAWLHFRLDSQPKYYTYKPFAKEQ